uniref:Uncharacterized protein n=1 Tax=viral metagenome TaxID=1070528 RepID=A0A6C0IY08_9ZZZZ
MNYDKIVNPKTGRKVNLNSKLGKIILEKYIRILNGGSSNLDSVYTQSGNEKYRNAIKDSDFFFYNQAYPNRPGIDFNFSKGESIKTWDDIEKNIKSDPKILSINSSHPLTKDKLKKKWEKFIRNNLIANEDALNRALGEDFDLTTADEFVCRQDKNIDPESLLRTHYDFKGTRLEKKKSLLGDRTSKTSSKIPKLREAYSQCITDFRQNKKDINEQWITVVTLKDSSNKGHKSLINFFTKCKKAVIKKNKIKDFSPKNYPVRDKNDLKDDEVIYHMPIFHNDKKTSEWQDWKKCKLSSKRIITNKTNRTWDSSCSEWGNAHGTFVGVLGDVETRILDKLIKYGHRENVSAWPKNSKKKQHERIFNLLGLNPGWGNYNKALIFDVQVKDLIRICLNSDVMAKKCIRVGSSKNKAWLQNITDSALGKGNVNNAPFTGLGYTYDIHNVPDVKFNKIENIMSENAKADIDFMNQPPHKKVKGIHEFLVPWGAVVKNLHVIDIVNYLDSIGTKIQSERLWIDK